MSSERLKASESSRTQAEGKMKGYGLQTHGEKHCADPQEVQHQEQLAEAVRLLTPFAERAGPDRGSASKNDYRAAAAFLLTLKGPANVAE